MSRLRSILGKDLSRLHLIPFYLLGLLLLAVGVGQPHRVVAQTGPDPVRLSVLIELREPSVAEVYAQMSDQNLVAGASLAAAMQAQLAQVEAAQQTLLAALESFDVQVLYRNQRVYNGIAVRVAEDQLVEIARLPAVKAIHPLIAKMPANARGAALIGAPQLWQGLNGSGLTGAGMTIAVIDTGIDYLHTDFGGPGVGYNQNNPTVITDVVGYPNLKIVGGYDFTGDLYNANPEDGNFNPALAPDPDPMDCYPHGTSVAGTAAGYGVNPDGSTYTGSYDQSTPLTNLRIGPGVAPAAQLYALKVFGCTGSSEIVDQAIEWAVDPNGDGDFSDRVDVINLSLGSDYGSPYDTTTLASDRAALLGVIVVAAAGNAGDRYYISSSPANANFALSVAASQPFYPAPQGMEGLIYESIAGFSARGPRRMDAALKPDLTAPGSSVMTAGQGTGNSVRSVSGTSLSTPFVAGSMALLRQRYPTWSVTELKALVMNTATSHLRTGEAVTTSLYSPVRTGAGRIDLVRALQADSVAYNATDPGLVSVSFGVPAVYTTSVFIKAVAVVNKSAQPLTYTVEYVAITDQPGVTIALPTTAISVNANSQITFPVSLTVNAVLLQRPRDPTVSGNESGFGRDWLSEESGYLLLRPRPFTATVENTLKVPIYTAPRAASSLHVTTQTLDFGTSIQQTATLTFTGAGLTTTHPLSGVQSLLSVALLQATSPPLLASEPLTVLQHVGYADLHYVGLAQYISPTLEISDPVANSLLYFAISAYEPWSSPNEVEIHVLIDVDQDGEDDFLLYNSDQVGYTTKRYSDSFISVLKNLRTNAQSRQGYLNGVSPIRTDPGIYNNRTMVLPVQAAALGLTQQQATFTYRVETYSNDALYRPNGQRRLIDQTGVLFYDTAQPGLVFRNSSNDPPPYADGAETVINVDFALAGYAAAGGQGILLLHHHNRMDNNVEVVPIRYQWANGLYLPVIGR